MGSVFSLQYALIGASHFDGPHGQYQADHEGRQRSTDQQRTLEEAQPGDDCQRRARGRRGSAKDVSGPNRTLTGDKPEKRLCPSRLRIVPVSEVFETRK
jgi:hypothetical protein